MGNMLLILKDNCISVSFLILAVMLVRVLLQKAPKSVRCFLWIIVGLKLLIPFQIESIFSLIPSEEQIQQNISTVQTIAFHRTMVALQPMPGAQQAVKQAIGMTHTAGKIPMSEVFCMVWIAGMVTMLTISVISYVRLKYRLRFAVPEMIGEDKVYRSEGIDTPFLLGFVKPRIYLPIEMNQEYISYVVAHEKTHMQRKDYLTKPIAYLLLIVYWFHPLVWISYLLFSKDLELACDELVVKKVGETNKKAYSEALLYCSVNRHNISACPVAFGEVAVKTRITNILNYKKPAFWAVIGAGILCIVVGVCFTTSQKSDMKAIEEDAGVVNTANTSNTLAPSTMEDSGKSEQTNQSPTGDSLDILTSAEGQFVSAWAAAFAGRDGQGIVDMSTEAVQSNLEEVGLLNRGEGYVGFGYSSPWPMGNDKDGGFYVSNVTNQTAEILYYAWVSDPHVTVWKENITFEKVEGTDAQVLNKSAEPNMNNDTNIVSGEGIATSDAGSFHVTQEEITYFDRISDLDIFYQAYRMGIITNTWLDYTANGFGEALNRNAMADSNSEIYQKLFTPEQAVRFLLNLSQDNTKVDITSKKQEDGTVQIEIAFQDAKSQKVILTMIQPYGVDGIWIPEDAGYELQALGDDGFGDVLFSMSENIQDITADQLLDLTTSEEISDTTNVGESDVNLDDQVGLLAQDETEDIAVYGLYTKQYGYRGIYIMQADDCNMFDLNWIPTSGGWAFSKILVLNKEDNGALRTFAITMPARDFTDSEIYDLYVFERYDTGTLNMSLLSSTECLKKIDQQIDYKVIEGHLVIKNMDGKVIYDEVVPEGVDQDATPVLMDELLEYDLQDDEIICSAVIGLQSEDNMSIGKRPPVLLKVEPLGEFGSERTFAVRDAYVDKSFIIREMPERLR